MKKFLGTFAIASLLLMGVADARDMIGVVNKSGHNLRLDVRNAIKTVPHKDVSAELADGRSDKWPWRDGDATIVRIEASAGPHVHCFVRIYSPGNFEIEPYARLQTCQFRLR